MESKLITNPWGFFTSVGPRESWGEPRALGLGRPIVPTMICSQPLLRVAWKRHGMQRMGRETPCGKFDSSFYPRTCSCRFIYGPEVIRDVWIDRSGHYVFVVIKCVTFFAARPAVIGFAQKLGCIGFRSSHWKFWAFVELGPCRAWGPISGFRAGWAGLDPGPTSLLRCPVGLDYFDR